MGNILVFDYGTTALKAALYDEELHALGVASREWVYSYPAPGFIEHSPESYWEKTVDAANELFERFGGRDDLVAVSVTGQAETLIAIDSDGNALGDAIVWLDTRPQEEWSRFTREYDQSRLYKATGNTGFDPVMPLLKLNWMQTHEPERYRAARMFLLIKEYIVYRLTGRFVGEMSTQSCSGYFNIVSCDWENDLLNYAHIDAAKLPELHDSQYIVGEVCSSARSAMGIGPGALVVNGLLDQCASSIGAGVTDNTQITETTGTVLAISAVLDEFEGGDDSMLVLRHGLPGKYLALPNCYTAGVLLKWFRDNFMHDGATYDEINKMIAARGRDESGLIVLPHFAGYLSPVNNASATGVIYGLTLDTTKYDVAHAIMEGVGFLLRENLELLERHGISSRRIISLGGGAKSPLWLKIKANICGREMVTLADDESTALGCAMNAALALGMIDINDIPALVSTARVTVADERAELYARKYASYRELNARLGFNPAGTVTKA